nr:CDP-alcohol phosphatidyltransferase family protein [Candidatus Baldrarchaeota archaeon]
MFKIRVKRIFHPVITRTAKILVKTPITPNFLTLISFLSIICASLFIIHGQLVAGGILIFIGGFLDGLDGELARITNRATSIGAFLDSVTDRYGDLILLLSFLFLEEIKILINFECWVILTIMGTFMTSYVRAKGEALGAKETNVGLIARSERLFILFLACELSILNFNIPAYAIAILAFLTNVTALQRIYLIGKQLDQETNPLSI